MKRREFINWAGIGLIASYLPVALVACSDNADLEDVSQTEEMFSVGTVDELEANSYLLNEESKVIVVKNSEDKLIALNPTCTHQGCTVEWQQDSRTLVCPCHDAKFAPDGKVLAKPAPSPLSTYEVVEENGAILVKLT